MYSSECCESEVLQSSAVIYDHEDERAELDVEGIVLEVERTVDEEAHGGVHADVARARVDRGERAAEEDAVVVTAAQVHDLERRVPQLLLKILHGQLRRILLIDMGSIRGFKRWRWFSSYLFAARLFLQAQALTAFWWHFDSRVIPEGVELCGDAQRLGEVVEDRIVEEHDVNCYSDLLPIWCTALSY